MQSKNSNIQLALIGCGGMGMGDARASTSLPGTKLVAGADIYDGRLQRMREIYGDGIFTTRDYREVLARPDVDAVIVATPDHWHARITVDALNADKDVYCEKPMVQKLEEGKTVVDAQKKTGRILQIGSQYASSLAFQKARQLIKEGAIGELNLVDAHLDRNTAIGAWQYSIPPDASPQNIDWDRFLGHAPKVPFQPIRLFRWRNYQDYGTGVAGDLFVHLLTGLHVATDSLGPNRIYAVGGTRHWLDGRDVPDVMLATLDYPKAETHPAFNLVLRVNLAAGYVTESFNIKLVGSEGVMDVTMDSLTVSKHPRQPESDYSLGSFPLAMQKKILETREKKDKPVTAETLQPETELRFSTPRGYSTHVEHHKNWHAAIRSRKPFFEDGVFGLRTAGPSLLTNTSLFEERVCTWDPKTMTAA
jgi:predicted dehydrogenase